MAPEDPAVNEYLRKIGKLGGKARTEALSPRTRKMISRRGGKATQAAKTPEERSAAARGVLRTGGTVDRKPLGFAPGNERVDINVNLLGPLALAFESSKSIKSTSFPLFKRIVEFAAIIDDFSEPVPLLSVKPRET